MVPSSFRQGPQVPGLEPRAAHLSFAQGSASPFSRINLHLWSLMRKGGTGAAATPQISVSWGWGVAAHISPGEHFRRNCSQLP